MANERVGIPSRRPKEETCRKPVALFRSSRVHEKFLHLYAPFYVLIRGTSVPCERLARIPELWVVTVSSCSDRESVGRSLVSPVMVDFKYCMLGWELLIVLLRGLNA